MWSTKLSIVLLIFLCSQNLAELPPEVTKCKAEDGDCISKTITEILKNNPNGRPEMGLPNLTPLKLKKLIVAEAKGDSPLNLDLVFHDVEYRGIPGAIVNRAVGFSKDAKTSKFEIYGVLPKLELTGRYKANGRILILPIQGDGAASIYGTNVKVSIKFKPNVVEKNGKIYLENSKVKLLLEPEKLQFHLENLFNGDKVLGDNMNRFLNENWQDVWTELGPNVNTALTGVLSNILSEVFKKITYDEFYLE